MCDFYEFFKQPSQTVASCANQKLMNGFMNVEKQPFSLPCINRFYCVRLVAFKCVKISQRASQTRSLYLGIYFINECLNKLTVTEEYCMGVNIDWENVKTLLTSHLLMPDTHPPTTDQKLSCLGGKFWTFGTKRRRVSPATGAQWQHYVIS